MRTSYFAAGAVAFVCALTGAQRQDDSGLVSADLPGMAYHAAFGKPVRADAQLGQTAARAALPGGAPSYPGSFEQVGHEPLMNRGMNAALAVHGRYAYVGSRTDGSHPNAGVLVVDVGDPAAPKVIHEIGRPEAANLGESSRELRVLPDKNLLLVLNHGCSELLHVCANTTQTAGNLVTSTVRFYDIAGENGARPKLVGTYTPSRSEAQSPHEFYVWTDPRRPSRVLIFETTPSTESSGKQGLYVVDASRAREGIFTEIGSWTTKIGNPERDNRLHSLSLSADGNRAFLAYLGGGFLVADTSDFAQDRPTPEVRLVTPVEKRVFWTDPGAHSAIQVPGRDVVMTTDEVYGKLGGVLADHGCPWGWTRFISVQDPAAPRIVGEFRPPWNRPEACAAAENPADRENFSSFSSHNPTLTPNLALVTWHSAGLMAIDIADPTRATGAAQFVPEPLPTVVTEDPALSVGRDKVVMWSFPVVQNGLIYAVDLRNGLYILRYRGPHADELSGVGFLDGNSNSGDVGRFEPEVPVVAAPGRRVCVPGPLTLQRRRVGPFALGATRSRTALRAGTPVSRRGDVSRWCVDGGRSATAVFRRGRLALTVTDAPRSRPPGPSRSGLQVTRGGRIVLRRGGRVRYAGVTSLRSRAAVVRALRAAGLPTR